MWPGAAGLTGPAREGTSALEPTAGATTFRSILSLTQRHKLTVHTLKSCSLVNKRLRLATEHYNIKKGLTSTDVRPGTVFVIVRGLKFHLMDATIYCLNVCQTENLLFNMCN